MDKDELDIGLSRAHWLNFPFLIANAGLFIFGIYAVFSVGIVTGLAIIGLSTLLSILVPKLLGKMVRKKFE